MRYSLLAVVAAVAALVMVGTAAAQGAGFAAPPADSPSDGTNTPWTADDARLEHIQDRYDLTDAQVEEIRDAVEAAMADGYDRLEIQQTVHDKLESFGIEVGEPLGLGPAAGPRGPPADAGDRFARGMGPMHGQQGPVAGQGGFGLRDGSCLA